MNKFYVIFPTCLLIAFGVYYTQFAKPEMAAHDLAAAKLVADKQAADEAHRLEGVLLSQLERNVSRHRFEELLRDRGLNGLHHLQALLEGGGFRRGASLEARNPDLTFGRPQGGREGVHGGVQQGLADGRMLTDGSGDGKGDGGAVDAEFGPAGDEGDDGKGGDDGKE